MVGDRGRLDYLQNTALLGHCGQQQSQKLAKTYYSNATTAILSFDATQPELLLKLTHCLDELKRNAAGRRIVLCVAACKCDFTAAPRVQDDA